MITSDGHFRRFAKSELRSTRYSRNNDNEDDEDYVPSSHGTQPDSAPEDTAFARLQCQYGRSEHADSATPRSEHLGAADAEKLQG